MKGNLYTSGLDIQSLNADLQVEGKWDIESAKSSEITILPDSGMIKKMKHRTLDKTVFEAFSTLFMSELLRSYNQVFSSKDFSLYAPETLRIEYGEPCRESTRSVLYQFFCPGTPVNKLRCSKERNYSIDDAPVRIEERVSYLSGIIYEVLLREGISHGDPQARHFFVLPANSQLRYMGRDMTFQMYESRNGLGVIDVENLRVEGPFSEESMRDAEKFKERVQKKFPMKRSEEYFDIGSRLVKHECAGFESRSLSERMAKAVFDRRFGSQVKRIDLTTGRIHYS